MQKTQNIDITKSYFPGDPNAFPVNLISTDQQDGEEQSLPVVAYEAYNILPTALGYKSFFGVESKLDFPALAAICDEVLLIQDQNYNNILIALASNGIWVLKTGDLDWSQQVVLTDDWTISGIYRQYTWCIIENDLYIYRAGDAVVNVLLFDGTWSSITPSFLNMSGQIGIFRANGRLGFWDSLNSVSWSDNFDYSLFDPDLETLAGFSIFSGVQGNIVTIKAHGEGFVIYATKSIVGVSYSNAENSMWDPMVLTAAGGVIDPKSVTLGASDKEHYAYTSMGIFKIGHFNALSRQYDFEPLANELYDLLKEDRGPVHLQCIGGRHLHIEVFSDKLTFGLVQWQDQTDPLVPASGGNATMNTETGNLTGSYITGTLVPEYDGGITFTGGSVDMRNNASSIAELPVSLANAFLARNFTLTAVVSFDPFTVGDGEVFQIKMASAELQTALDTFFFSCYFEATYSTATDNVSIVPATCGYATTLVNYDITDAGSTPTIVGANTPVTLQYRRTGNLQEALVNGVVVNSRTDAILETIPAAVGLPLGGLGLLGLNLSISLDVESIYVRVASWELLSNDPINNYYDYGTDPTFALRSGAPAVGYNTIKGSLVYDLNTKKWGKNANDAQAILSLSPINNTLNPVLTPTDFAVDSGILSTDGFIKKFSVVVTDSLIKYGKVGLSRIGYTNMFEVIAHFRNPATGTIFAEPSFDGRTVYESQIKTQAFTDELFVVLYVDLSARWFNIGLTGTFDLTYLEFRATIGGRR